MTQVLIIGEPVTDDLCRILENDIFFFFNEDGIISAEVWDKLSEMVPFREVLEPIPEVCWQQDDNAIKATETMVTIMRMFRYTMKSVFVTAPILTRRTMFSRSGYLPKKIRRIRCDK